jgi:50S ribosomal subunit-associated GTPase HflX
VVVGSITQQIDRPNPATYLGKGKIEELGTLIQDSRERTSRTRRGSASWIAPS